MRLDGLDLGEWVSKSSVPQGLIAVVRLRNIVDRKVQKEAGVVSDGEDWDKRHPYSDAVRGGLGLGSVGPTMGNARIGEDCDASRDRKLIRNLRPATVVWFGTENLTLLEVILKLCARSLLMHGLPKVWQLVLRFSPGWRGSDSQVAAKGWWKRLAGEEGISRYNNNCGFLWVGLPHCYSPVFILLVLLCCWGLAVTVGELVAMLFYARRGLENVVVVPASLSPGCHVG